MQIHQLQAATRRKKKKLVGRGGKRGTTAGRGTKGQKARAGHKIRPELRDAIKELPKLRGYRFNSFYKKPATVKLRDLARHLAAGSVVTPAALFEKHLIESVAGHLPEVKIVGAGSLAVALTITDCQVSAGVKKIIELAHGKVSL